MNGYTTVKYQAYGHKKLWYIVLNSLGMLKRSLKRRSNRRIKTFDVGLYNELESMQGPLHARCRRWLVWTLNKGLESMWGTLQSESDVSVGWFGLWIFEVS